MRNALRACVALACYCGYWRLGQYFMQRIVIERALQAYLSNAWSCIRVAHLGTCSIAERAGVAGTDGPVEAALYCGTMDSSSVEDWCCRLSGMVDAGQATWEYEKWAGAASSKLLLLLLL
jgi:hypothetical protein